MAMGRVLWSKGLCQQALRSTGLDSPVQVGSERGLRAPHPAWPRLMNGMVSFGWSAGWLATLTSPAAPSWPRWEVPRHHQPHREAGCICEVSKPRMLK